MNTNARVFIAGHHGLVGSAIVRRLQADGFTTLLLRSRSELDLTDSIAVRRFFDTERPDYVFLAAARVGGILANQMFPADFIRDNLAIELNVIDAAYRAGAQKLLFMGSSCIYPRLAPQPLHEDYLLSGPLEPTNQWYAVAKIAGIKLCQAYNRQYRTRFISAMPTNVYGPGDNFELDTSHVLPALIRKVHEAQGTGSPEVVVWGTGTPRREFIHVDDVADACIFIMRTYDDDTPINVGAGSDVTIAELASLVADVIGYEGRLVYDPSKPDGTPQKLLDVTKLSKLGWQASIGLREGIVNTLIWYQRERLVNNLSVP